MNNCAVYNIKVELSPNDSELQNISLEHKIQKFILDDNKCLTTFKYNNIDNDFIELYVYTYNPIHEATFLLVKMIAQSKYECLNNTLAFLKKKIHPNIFKTYAVEWVKKGDIKTKVSYFYVKSLRNLFEKFYSDKNEHDYIIYNIMLRPES